MATAITASCITSPSPENFYLVEFTGQKKKSYKNGPWAHLLHSQIIKRFVPVNNSLMTKSFEEDIKTIRYQYPLHIDPVRNVLITIPTKDLVNFSGACRSFYLATRSSTIWKTKLKQLLPSVTYLKHCSFNCEQQFQIVFHRISKLKRPYLLQLLQYENVRKDILEKIGDLKAERPTTFTSVELNEQLIELLGGDFNGAAESIAPNSKMGRCMYACCSISKELNDQGKFEEVIRASEKIYQWEYLHP